MAPSRCLPPRGCAATSRRQPAVLRFSWFLAAAALIAFSASATSRPLVLRDDGAHAGSPGRVREVVASAPDAAVMRTFRQLIFNVEEVASAHRLRGERYTRGLRRELLHCHPVTPSLPAACQKPAGDIHARADGPVCLP